VEIDAIVLTDFKFDLLMSLGLLSLERQNIIVEVVYFIFGEMCNHTKEIITIHSKVNYAIALRKL
jgi:hypothetical protein